MVKALLPNWSGILFLFAFVALPHPTESWIPPSSSAENPLEIDPNWEPVQVMRERLGIEYNYTPSLLHPEMCRYVSPKECEMIDGNLQRHAASHRRRHLQREENPSLGTIKVLVLLIQFNDHTNDRVLIEQSVVENIWKTDVKRWFSENSQGAYEVDPVVVDWIVTDNSESYYAFDVQGRTPELQFAMYPALDQLDADPNWDWSQFDVDGDGQLDAVMMMHSGFDAVVNEPDCKGREASQRIFPHAYSTTSDDAWTSSDGSVSLNGYSVGSVFNGVCDGEPFAIGITCHEYMHTMGLIDLYNVANPEEAEGVGLWDIMSNPYGADNTGNPGFLSSWSRSQVDWVAPEEITYDGIYVLKPAATSTQAYQINLNPFGFAPEYLLIENRQQISYDEGLWDKGLIIWHIDDAAKGMEQRGYPGQEGWPENGNHYQVAVLPKDGNYDLEQNVNKGDAGDMWLPGDVLGPGMGNTVFPNTDSYQQGYILETGITIEVLSQAANGDVVFQVIGLAPAPEGTTTTPTPPVAGPEVAEPTTPSPEPATTEPSITTPSSAVAPAPVPAAEMPDAVSTTEPPVDATDTAPGIISGASTVFSAADNLQASSAFSWNLVAIWKFSFGMATVLALC